VVCEKGKGAVTESCVCQVLAWLHPLPSIGVRSARVLDDFHDLFDSIGRL
jgi:hypothetical protein